MTDWEYEERKRHLKEELYYKGKHVEYANEMYKLIKEKNRT